MNTRRQITLLAVAVTAAAFLPACSGGGSSDTTTTTDTTATTTGTGTTGAATPMAGGPPGMPGGYPGMGGPPGMPGGYPGAAGGAYPGAPAPAAPAGGVASAAKTPPPKPIPHRPDPFKVPWQHPAPPPYVFNDLQPIRVASANIVTPPSKPTVVRQVPDRRVSGIMSGDGVYAILESGNDEPEIVKPGSLTRDGYRVISINSKSVKLERKEGNYILTQDVPLTDSPVAPNSSFPTTAGFQPGGGGIGRPPFGGGIGGGGLGGKNGAD